MCKRIFVIILLLVVIGIMRGEAQQLNYQAIARNANGVALTFRDVGIRLSIRDGSPNGSIVYSESRNIRTNQFGLFTVIIGSPGASNVLGSMASINWISGNKYLQVEIDPEGGTNYFQAGTSQLQAVPYALFANAAYPVGPAGGDLLGSTYPNPVIAPLAVTTGKIANQAITTPKIADQAVTNAKILDNTIANIKLVNSRVTLNGLILNLGDSQDFALGTTGTDVNIVSAGNTHRFNFPDASIANRGLITPNAQTIGGNKTFNNNVTAASFIRAGGIAAQFLKADGSVDNNIYLTENQPIIVTATGDATGVSTSSRTAPVLPLTLATVNSAVGTYGTNIVVPSITVNNKGLVTNVIANPIPTATATTSGLLTVGDWNIFNNKQNAIPLGSSAQYFRGDLTLSNFTTDVRNQLSAGTNITYANGNIGLTNNSVTLNTLPLTLGGSQAFATGTTGVDFNISSVGSVHSFNIPTASVFARGLLTSIDYTNFNAAYNNRITSLTTTGTSGAATLSGNVLNIPNYTYTLPAATATTLGGITTGANITNTSGNISITNTNVISALGTQTANRFFASPNGSNGLPSFRALALEDFQDNLITNSKLASSSFNLGTTNIPLGSTANTLTGLTSITSSNFIGPLSGNASTASTWANARTISTTGDVTYISNPFDGSGNTTGVATLANSGVTPGNYGNANTIPSLTVDSKGRITSITNNAISNISPIGSSLNSGNIIIGNASNLAVQVQVTGDVTISNTGVTTIGALKVTDAMLAPGITDGKLATISTAGKVANSATTATALNTPNTIVLRDASGNFAAGNITANLTGNVTGNVSGTAGSVINNLTFASDGSGAIPSSTFNGSAARIISYNSIGASPLAGSGDLVTVGTITAGTWNGNVIGIAQGGTGQTTKTNAFNALSPMSQEGDIIYGSGVNGSGERLAKGTNGQVLTMAGNIPSWASYSGWKIDGNSGLHPTDNFLGTLDNVALKFKVESVPSGIISTETGGKNNTSFGLNTTIFSNTGAEKNTAIGAGSMFSLTTGKDNTAIGQATLILNTIGDNNTAIGQSALSKTTGSSNTAIGQASMQNNTGGFNNSALGKDALFTNTTGTYNTAIGHFSFRESTGSFNAGLGQNSFGSLTTGNNNVGIGFQAGKFFNGIEVNSLTTSSNSVFIGTNAGPSSNTSSNQIVIGYNAIGVSDNSVQLGNTSITKVNTSGSMNATKFVGKNGTSSTTLTSIDASTTGVLFSGNDAAGTISFTTTSAISVGNFLTITFGIPFENTPVVLINAIEIGSSTANTRLMTEMFCLHSQTTTDLFRITSNSALTPGRTYNISYHVIGR